MSIQTEIDRIKGNIASAYSSAGAKGATLPAVQNSANLAGCIDTITGGGGEPATRFGVSFDDFVGYFDENGVLQAPTGDIVLDLTGVTKVGNNVFRGTFYGSLRAISIIANDVTFVGNYSFMSACNACLNVTTIEFNSLEEVGSTQTFAQFNQSGLQGFVPYFKKLKTISGQATFQHFCAAKINPDESFPALEYISGIYTLASFRQYSAGDTITFSAVKTIVGSPHAYSAVLGSFYVKDTVWNFPNATSFTGYIWNVTASYPGEIHFAAANQAAIEACDGYANKWGFAGATIYFDL